MAIGGLSYSRFAILMLVGVVSLGLFAPAAFAGDCPGESYTYDHGECTDTTGDTTDLLIHSFNESEALNQGTLSRSRGSAPRREVMRAGRIDTAQMARDITAINSFVPVSPSPVLAYLEPRFPKSRRVKMRGMVASALAEYRAQGPARGFYPNYTGSAALLAVESAYATYDGTHFSDPRIASTVGLSFAMRLAQRRAFAMLSNRGKQLVHDLFVVASYGLYYELLDAHETKSKAEAADARRQALRLLLAMGIDPRREPIDQVACIANVMPMVTGCGGYLYSISGGRAGVDPFRPL